MKSLVLLATVLVSASSYATTNPKILDCNISFGSDQQVTVRSTPDGLILEELTNSGSFVRRPLTEKELASGKLKLRKDSPSDAGTLTRDKDGRWFYNFDGAMGYADCTSPADGS